MFSPSSFTASTPCVTADWACSTTPVATRFTRASGEDLRGLAEWAGRRGTPVWVRLVTGAYWDYETVIAAQNDWPVPVWTQKWQSDACYERCARLLMENHDWLRPAFGTHNVDSCNRT